MLERNMDPMNIETKRAPSVANLLATTPDLSLFGDVYRAEVDRLLGVVASVQSTEQYLRRPVETATTFVGPNALAIDMLVRHLIAAESHWLSLLPSLRAGAVMTLPNPPVLPDSLAKESVEAAYQDKVLVFLPEVLGMTEAAAREPIVFRSKEYEKRAFLWVLLVHHSYHLGQIDLMLRQQNVLSPEHLRF